MLYPLLILLLIHYIGLFIFKSNPQVLACGIFGQCTNTPRKINQSNIKILGMFNESRGKHSCGLTMDSKILHGLEKNKLFTDFIKGKTFKPVENPSIIGHTRSASVGAAINEYNVHPFGFGKNKKGDYKFIGVHNGTLYNHLELAEKYGISTKAKYLSTISGAELERTKIDSEIILEIIHKTRNFKVLSEYIGKAALVWTDTDAPNVMYFWSGKSRMTESYVNGPEMEERPMNIWLESKNNFYFSSMPESLEAIGAVSDEVFQIEYNTVYQVTNGDFKHAQLTPISRKKCFQTESYNHSKNYNYAGFNSGKEKGGEKEEKEKNDYSDYCDIEERYLNRFEKVVPGATATLNNLKPEVNIYDDKTLLPKNDYKDKVYSEKLRYYQNGHLIKGVFCYIAHYGFYKLGDTQSEAESAFEKNKGLRFLNGSFAKDPTILLGVIPFPKGNSIPSLYYFIEGVMIRERIEYIALTFGDPKNYQDYIKLSEYSKHPVINLTFAYKNENSQNIVLGGKSYTGSVTSLGMEKVYHISNGNLVRTTNKADVKKEETSKEMILVDDDKVFNEKILTSAFKNIKEIEEKIIKEEILDKMADKIIDENTKQDHQDIVESTITEMIDSEITPCLMSFQNCREALDILPGNHPRVIETKEIINTLITTISKFTS